METINIQKFIPRIDDKDSYKSKSMKVAESAAALRKYLQAKSDQWFEEIFGKGAQTASKCLDFIRKWAWYIHKLKVGQDKVIDFFGENRLTIPILEKIVNVMYSPFQTACSVIDVPDTILTIVDTLVEITLLLLMTYILATELSSCFGKDKEQAWRRFCATIRTVQNHVVQNCETYKKITRLLLKLFGYVGCVFLFDITCYILSDTGRALKSQLVLWIRQNPVVSLGICSALITLLTFGIIKYDDRRDN